MPSERKLDLVAIRNLVVAGWTGRNTAALEAHIKELEAVGVKRPKSVPIFYRNAVSLLTTADTIQVVADKSSGEVEFVLYSLADGLWVIGDPAGPELHTHVSHYQGELAARMALGESVAPDYRAIPRATYTDPEA